MFEETIIRSLVLAVVVVVAFLASAFSTYSAKTSDSSVSLSLKSNFLDNNSDKSDENQFEGAEQVTLKDLVGVYQKIAENNLENKLHQVSNSDAEAHPQALTTYQ